MEQRSQTVALLLVIVLLTGCSRGAKVCAVCQRDECKAMAFRMTLDNGKTIETCCPRCGLHYLEANQQHARSVEATDFATGQWLDATKAVFVSGSDVRPCAEPEPRRDAQGCCLYVAYDRCLPSLVAFADRSAAAEFQRLHGGEVQSFAELSAQKPAEVSN
jgi:hypothetical protein